MGLKSLFRLFKILSAKVSLGYRYKMLTATQNVD